MARLAAHVVASDVGEDMAKAVRLVSPSGAVSDIRQYGFDWSMFFLSGAPAIMRGETAAGVAMLAFSIVGWTFDLLPGLLINLVIALEYNKLLRSSTTLTACNIVGLSHRQ